MGLLDPYICPHISKSNISSDDDQFQSDLLTHEKHNLNDDNEKNESKNGHDEMNLFLEESSVVLPSYLSISKKM